MAAKNNKIGKVPNLRLPGFEGEWETKKLGEITSWSSGGTPSKDNPLYWNGDVPWISASSMRGLVYSDSDTRITQEGLKKGSKLASKGSLLILVRGSMLFNKIPVGIASKDLAFNQDVKSIVINDSSIPEYVLNWFLASEAKLLNMVTGTGIGAGKLELQDLKELEIKIPSLPEQRKIASFLSIINTRIETQNKIIEELKLLKNTLSKKMLSGQLRFKDGHGNDFPAWQIMNLGELGNFQTSSIDKLSRENEREVFLVNYMNVYRHENINKETLKSFQIVTAKDAQIESCNLKKGDILFTPSSETSNDIGHSVVIFEDLKNTVFSYHLMRFRPKTELDILYSHYFCNTPSILNQLSKLSTGSTRFTISVKSFSQVETFLPCKEEQSKIANLLSKIDLKLLTEDRILQKLQFQKQYMLANLFI